MQHISRLCFSPFCYLSLDQVTWLSQHPEADERVLPHWEEVVAWEGIENDEQYSNLLDSVTYVVVI